MTHRTLGPMTGMLQPRVSWLRYYFEGRLFEWAMTIPTLALGVALIIWPGTMRAHSLSQITEFVPPLALKASLFGIGWLGFVGLLFNGWDYNGIRVGAIIRAAVAILRAWLWSQFSLGFLHLSFRDDAIAPGLLFWGWFTLIECCVVFFVAGGIISRGKGRERAD